MQAQDCQEEEDEYVFAVIGGKITVYIGGIIGTFIENLTVGSKCVSAEFTVIKGRKEPLLGRESAIELGVLKLQGPLNLVADNQKIQGYIYRNRKVQGLSTETSYRSADPAAQTLRRPAFGLKEKIERNRDA